jgi:hypothetical protein
LKDISTFVNPTFGNKESKFWNIFEVLDFGLPQHYDVDKVSEGISLDTRKKLAQAVLDFVE